MVFLILILREVFLFLFFDFCVILSTISPVNFKGKGVNLIREACLEGKRKREKAKRKEIRTSKEWCCYFGHHHPDWGFPTALESLKESIILMSDN